MSSPSKSLHFYHNLELSALLNPDASGTTMRAGGNLISERQFRQGESPRAVLSGIDSNGSVIFASDTERLASVAYTPFGNSELAPSHPGLLGFNGQLRDHLISGYFLGSYRIFSPLLMRFFSPDASSPFGSGGINAYAYCENDPINYTDPSGHGKTSNSNPTARPSNPNPQLRKMQMIQRGRLAAKQKNARYQEIFKDKITELNNKDTATKQEMINLATERINKNKDLIGRIKEHNPADKDKLIRLVSAASLNIARAHELKMTESTGLAYRSPGYRRIQTLAINLALNQDETLTKILHTHQQPALPTDTNSNIRQSSE